MKKHVYLSLNATRFSYASLLVVGVLGIALALPPAALPQTQISVAISPASYGLTVSQSILLAATVANDSSNKGVTWSVSGSACSGSTCGTLAGATSTTVNYTAPTVAGVYLVTATSVADPTKTATASIGVTDLAGVFTYRNDGTRTSINGHEYLLNTSNVNTSSFGKIFSCPVDGSVYAQPLWVANVSIGGGIHNIIIVVTQHDSVYAFDADNGSGTTCTQYWKASMLTSAYGAASGATTVPPADTGETGDIPTEIGITSTPVIDPATKHLFVVSKTKEAGQYYQRLHRLNLADGTESASSPVVISASVSGTGNGSSGGRLPYIALRQNQRPGLALVNGIVYIASGSHGDNAPWHGWIVGYNASTMAFASAYCTTPNSDGGGIWMSGSAPVFDSSNNLFVISSNGTYDGNTEFSDSFLKLSTASGLTVSDWFTPDNQQSLGANNIDLGQGGAVTLLDSVSGPYPHLLIGGGKGGILYLVNRDLMGHYHTGDNTQTVQNWSLGSQIASSGTFWQNTFYIGAAGSPLQAFTFNTSNDTFFTNPSSQSNATIAFPGLTPAVSAAGTSNGIIWAVDSSKSGTNGAATGPAVLYAFDPNNLGNELWDSSQATGARDQGPNAVKFVVPTVANGKVYVGGVNAVTVYGLLSLPPSAAPPTFNPGPGGYASAQNVSLSDSTSGAAIYYTLDGSTPTTSSTRYTTPINVTGNTEIKAIAVVAGLNNSAVATGDYTIGGFGNGTITYIQGNYATPQSSPTSVSVTYQGPQTAGDLNVVVVGWNDATANISSVVDSNGNNYTLAIGPTRVGTALSQAIYYFANIPASAAGANTVKVTFSTAAAYPDVRILEYYGADPNNPVDVTIAGTGSSTTSSTPAVTTTNANDLLFAANTVTSITSGPGAGFTSRMLTAPDADIAEDRAVVATGSYSASAGLNPTGQWVMQMVAFRAASTGGTDTTPPTPPSNLMGPGPIVQATQGYINSTAQTVHTTAAFDSTGGDLLVVFASSHAGVTMTPSDSYNNTWISAAGPTNTSTGFDLRSQIWYAKNPTVGPGHTFTLTLSAAQSLVISIFVVQGSNIPAPIDAISTIGDDAGTQSLNVTSPTITTTSVNDLLIGFAKSSVAETFTSGTGFTPQPVASSNFLDSENEIAAPPSAYAATFGLSTSATWQSAVVAVDPPSTPDGSLPPGSDGPSNSSSTEIDLIWTASTDNVGVTGYLVERCQGVGCSNFAQIATTIGTAYNDTGLTPSTTYYYRVRATDAAGNLSGYSNIVAANTQPPQVPVPTVTSVSPGGGPIAGGTPVTITGTNFAAGATVMFGSNSATNVVVVSATQIAATTPAGSAGAVTVTVTVNGQAGSLTNGYTYDVPATVTSVSPNTGTTAGGTSVTITGTNFATGATVTFGSNAATNVVVVSGTQITATTPAGTAGAVTVTVTNPGVAGGSLASGFTYVVIPTVTSVSPNTGTTAGGTSVTITGTNFAAGATVTIGSNAATNVVVVSGTQITATTPAGSIGAVTVTVTVNGQAGSLASGFTYVAPPTVTSVSPNVGTTAGGTSVTITGTNFVTGATVTFGSNAATNVTIVSSTQITAATPAGAAGAVTVTVTNPGSLVGSLTNGYTYVVVPTVASITPNNGPIGGGTSVTITGTNFAAGATVTIGSNAATNVTIVSSTQITATTPAHAAGAATVTVTVNGQSGSLTNGFTYLGAPTVTSLSPNNGPTAGGTSVTITGTNFAAGATVTFGATAATNVVVVSGTQITATTPAGSVGAVTVTVTVNGQSGSLTNGFTYNAAVAISFGQVAAATPQSSTATVTIAYPGAQTAGDLNIVVVGWNDTTAAVSTVKDSAGNTYNLAIGPTTGTALQQSIYYAANIAGGSNTVTVTFNQAAAYPDVRILEYRGVTTLDAKVGASGSSAAPSSGSATTTSANELIFGANTIYTTTKAAGTGFTSRIVTSPDSDLAEDMLVTSTGSYSATATLNSSGPWVMQMVTFK